MDLIKRIEALKRDTNNCPEYILATRLGYNKAIDDVLEIIKEAEPQRLDQHDSAGSWWAIKDGKTHYVEVTKSLHTDKLYCMVVGNELEISIDCLGEWGLDNAKWVKVIVPESEDNNADNES